MKSKIDSRKINSRHFQAEKSRLTRYLRLNSCSLLVGTFRPESKIRFRRMALTLATSIIFIIGFIFVVF